MLDCITHLHGVRARRRLGWQRRSACRLPRRESLGALSSCLLLCLQSGLLSGLPLRLLPSNSLLFLACRSGLLRARLVRCQRGLILSILLLSDQSVVILQGRIVREAMASCRCIMVVRTLSSASTRAATRAAPWFSMACARTFMKVCALLAPEKLAAREAFVPELTRRSAMCGNVACRSMPLTLGRGQSRAGNKSTARRVPGRRRYVARRRPKPAHSPQGIRPRRRGTACRGRTRPCPRPKARSQPPRRWVSSRVLETRTWCFGLCK